MVNHTLVQGRDGEAYDQYEQGGMNRQQQWRVAWDDECDQSEKNGGKLR